MEFMLGCNYWASNAGADMWRSFDAAAIEKDLATLKENGVRYMRVFPNWRDFQPVAPNYTAGGAIAEYYADCKRSNKYYLDEEMLDRFSIFLDLCEKYSMRLIVGLITGWMSGALFIPTALYGKNLISDSFALYLEQLFIKGFVEQFKEHSAIYAWDLGNECNGMSHASRYDAACFSATVSNAIRAVDPERPIVSGMHGLTLDGNWRIEDQGEFTDLLTTHPYPYWCEHTRIDETLSFRTTLHPTAQSKFYADLGKKPCLAEEIGTMGPMVCSDENAAHFMRVNLFSLWANGATGALWWCASDQTHLTTFPYTRKMVELELGMINQHGEAKPVLKEVKRFADFLKTAPTLSPAKSDAVCLLTRGQDHWGVGYMSYILARKAGFNLSFAYAEDQLPDADLYLMPSVNGAESMPIPKYEALKKRVYEGADLYISFDNAILPEFEALVGLKVIDSYEHNEGGELRLKDASIAFHRVRTFTLKETTAEVLLRDGNGNPFIASNRYGKGRVFFVNAPIEQNLIGKANAFEGNTHELYKMLFKEYIEKYPVFLSNPSLLFTLHKSKEGTVAVVINHTKETQDFTVMGNLGVARVLYGKESEVAPFDASVLLLK